jgi:hypothetical protein
VPDALVKAAPEQFFIAHPPWDLLITNFPDAVPNLYVPALHEAVIDLAAHLRAIQKEYQRTQNGIHVLSAFLMTTELKLYPPRWVLDAMAGAFKNYWSAPQSKSLDALLRLKGGRGQGLGYKTAVRRTGDFVAAHDMWLLEQKFGLTVDEAAEVVEAKLRLSPRRKGRWGERAHYVLTQESLAKQYSRIWRKAYSLTKANFQRMALELPDKYWTGFLKSFPTSDLHDDVKSKLRLS